MCRINRSLYGLKQSSRQWNTKFDQALKDMGFDQSIKDPRLYIKKKPLIYITIYVDDVVIAGEKSEAVQAVKSQLKSRFNISDMGKLHHVLEIKVTHGRNAEISLSQEHYIRNLLKRFKLENMKVYSTPSDPSLTLQKPHDDGTAQLMNATLHQSMVGSLMFCSLGSRPEIQHAVSSAARHCSKPNQHNLTAVKRIFSYLKGTVNIILTYRPEKRTFTGLQRR